MKAWYVWMKFNGKKCNEKGKEKLKENPNERAKKWLPKRVEELMQVLHVEDLNCEEERVKPLKKAKQG